MTPVLTLGPVLFNWSPEAWRDFYFQIADESPVERVYVGEVICSKRAPLFKDYFDAVMTRLQAAGKTPVISTLAEVSSTIDRRLAEKMANYEGFLIEANDASALWHLKDKPHLIGPYVNVYNEESLTFFAEKGARSICLPPEMPASGIKELGAVAAQLGVDLEVQVYGRIPLALSARCYHARAHGLTKDSCKFICDKDPDGMVLRTLDDQPFLAINGIQTMSYHCLNLANELSALAATGIGRFRISPHAQGTLTVTQVFRDILDEKISPEEANAALEEVHFDAPFSNGFYHQKAGTEWRIG